MFLEDLELIALPYNFAFNFPNLWILNIPASIPCDNIGFQNLRTLHNRVTSANNKAGFTEQVFSDAFRLQSDMSYASYYNSLSAVDGVVYPKCTLGDEIVSFSDAFRYYEVQNSSWVCSAFVEDYLQQWDVIEVTCSVNGGECIHTGSGRDYCVCRKGYVGDGYNCSAYPDFIVIESEDEKYAVLVTTALGIYALYLTIVTFSILRSNILVAPSASENSEEIEPGKSSENERDLHPRGTSLSMIGETYRNPQDLIAEPFYYYSDLSEYYTVTPNCNTSDSETNAKV